MTCRTPVEPPVEPLSNPVCCTPLIPRQATQPARLDGGRLPAAGGQRTLVAKKETDIHAAAGTRGAAQRRQPATRRATLQRLAIAVSRFRRFPNLVISICLPSRPGRRHPTQQRRRSLATSGTRTRQPNTVCRTLLGDLGFAPHVVSVALGHAHIAEGATAVHRQGRFASGNGLTLGSRTFGGCSCCRTGCAQGKVRRRLQLGDRIGRSVFLRLRFGRACPKRPHRRHGTSDVALKPDMCPQCKSDANVPTPGPSPDPTRCARLSEVPCPEPRGGNASALQSRWRTR